MLNRKIFVLSFVALLILSFSALAQDPAPIYPENYKVIVESDRVRVMDFKLRKGAKEDFHAHPAHVVYVLAGFKIMFRFPDGRTALRETKTGDVLFSEAVMRYEIWRNPQALEDHKATPHLKASFAIRQQQGWMTEITTWNRVREDFQPAEQARKN